MSDEKHNPELLTVKEACEYLGYSAEELRDLVTTCKLVPDSYQDNESPLFSPASIETLRSEEETFLPEIESEPEASDHTEEEEEDFNPNQRTEPAEIVRDRIVILGRRRAGKTVFLSRLYDMCWNAHQDQNLHMECHSGASHKNFCEAMQLMKDKEWPDATLGETYSKITITRNGRETEAIVLDYPGEVFRRAFVDGIQDGPARELLAHVDRAAGVILLIDPGIALCGDIDEYIDDDYGLVKAVRRIRESPGGAIAPIAVVLTKCDQNRQRVKEWSKKTGVRKRTDLPDRQVLLNELYANLMRVLQEHGCVKTYASSAVHTSMDSSGKEVPSLSKPPRNVSEPVAWCIDEMRKAEDVRREDREAAGREVAWESQQSLIKKMAKQDKETADRDHVFKIIKFSLLAAGLTIAFCSLVALMVSKL